jgi:hypothetical protein
MRVFMSIQYIYEWQKNKNTPGIKKKKLTL